MLQIVKSLSIVFIISGFIGGCCQLLGVSFWPVFGLSVLTQFILYDLFSRWRKSKIEVQFRQLENERIKAFSEQGLEVTCPKCNAEIKIYLGTKCFLKTTPVEDDPFKKHNFVTNTDYEQEQ